jgi:hypothetical protein
MRSEPIRDIRRKMEDLGRQIRPPLAMVDQRPRRARTARRRSLTTLVLLLALVGVAATGCRPTCDPPYPAVEWQADVADTRPWPAGSTERAYPRSLFDTDGDGVEDTVEGATGAPVPAVTIHRASGDVTFTLPDGMVAPVEQLGSDHDGDGRSDIIVAAAGPTGYSAETYVIPGSVPNGTYDPSTVGTHLVDAWLPMENNRVGDVTGDGADDLVFTGDYETWLFDGAEIMAAGPGERYPWSPEILNGGLIDSVQVKPGLFALVLIPPGPNEVAVWVRGTLLRFTTANSGLPVSQNNWANLGANVVDGPGDQVRLVVWLEDGPGHLASRWAWNLRPLCPAEPPTTVTARPAAG